MIDAEGQHVKNIELRAPVEQDCSSLSELVFESKASHGYNDSFMEACRDELLVTPKTLQKGPCHSVWDTNEGAPLGLVQLVPTGDQTCQLELLFISPRAQNLGLGKRLFDWAVSTAKQKDFSMMTINADPGAEEFYKKLGAIRIGEQPSGSFPDRFLPRLRFNLE